MLTLRDLENHIKTKVSEYWLQKIATKANELPNTCFFDVQIALNIYNHLMTMTLECLFYAATGKDYREKYNNDYQKLQKFQQEHLKIILNDSDDLILYVTEHLSDYITAIKEFITELNYNKAIINQQTS